MNFKMIAMIATAIFAVGSTGTSASAQGCGCGGGAGVFGNQGGFRSADYNSNCGRGISSAQAASLWAGYCTDNCAYTGPRRQGLLRGHGGGCGLKNGGGCLGGGGCFGYPSCGCGCGGGFGNIGSYSSCGCGGGHLSGGCGCGLKAKLAALHSAGPISSCGRGGCLSGGCLSGGCGIKGRIFNNALARHSRNAYAGFASSDACSSCSFLSGGCDNCGSCGGYFDQAVGYEYGNGGMQSCVSGCLTGACGGDCGCGS